MNLAVTSYVRITKDRYIVDDQSVEYSTNQLEESWLKQLYKVIQPDYPKFHKMDQLSQASFLAVELWKNRRRELQKDISENTALVFANRETSSVTDQLFIDSYTNTVNASPSLFVYTLPNILLGELCIRNKWYGENIFAVFPKFAFAFYKMNADVLLSDTTSIVLCGWVNVSKEGTEVIVFSIERETSKFEWEDPFLTGR